MMVLTSRMGSTSSRLLIGSSIRAALLRSIAPRARNPLRFDGMFNGKLKSDTTCGGNKTLYLQTGNYMNYLVWTTTSNQPRLGLAKGTLHSYVNSTEGIRFGLMVFNANGQGGSVTAPVSDDKNSVYNALSDIQPATWSIGLLSQRLSMKPCSTLKGDRAIITLGRLTTVQFSTDARRIMSFSLPMERRPMMSRMIHESNSPYGSFPVIGDYDRDGQDSGTYGDPLLTGIPLSRRCCKNMLTRPI